ncbi:MAG: hypothetical protein IH594_17340 [Bacteroidales bacterium]|nr:hypothetical protein [Bacteroidales bacterium]
MCETIRTAEKAIGSIAYTPTPSASKGKKFSRSLFAVENIRKGEMLTLKNVRSIRPGDGLHPKYLEVILGKKTRNDIPYGTPIKMEDIKF